MVGSIANVIALVLFTSLLVFVRMYATGRDSIKRIIWQILVINAGVMILYFTRDHVLGIIGAILLILAGSIIIHRKAD